MEARLRSIGRDLAVPDPREGTVEAILARLEREPLPVAPSTWQRFRAALGRVGNWLQNRWRLASAVAATALLVLFVASPAGAAVREWLGFGGVVVVTEPAPDRALAWSAPASASLTALLADTTEIPLAQARSMVEFDVGVPGALGEPDRVGVTADGRAVVMQWSAPNDSQVELDQIAGSPDPYFFKKYYQDLTFATVDGREALWLVEPHPIVVLAPDGTERSRTARQSGPALIWQRSGVTLRLEGVPDLDRAIEIAESVDD